MKVGSVVCRWPQTENPGEVIEVFDPPIQKPGSWRSHHLKPSVIRVDAKVKWIDGTETYEGKWSLYNLFDIIQLHRNKVKKYKKLHELVKPLPIRRTDEVYN